MAASLTFAFNVCIPSDSLLFIRYTVYTCIYALFCYSRWGGTLSEVFMIMNFTLTYRQTPFDAI